MFQTCKGERIDKCLKWTTKLFIHLSDEPLEIIDN